MKLNHLADHVLLNNIYALVLTERETTAKILYHLKEIDRRKLFSDLRYGSLYEYCVRELGYSEAGAHRRIVAARMLAEIPEIERKLEEGVLTLTNISQAQQFFKQNVVIKPEEKKLILGRIEGMSKKECEKELFKISGEKLSAKESKKRVSENENQVTLILSDETLAELDKLKSLMGKDLSMDQLVLLMAKTTIQKVEKDKFKLTNRPKVPRAGKGPTKRSPSAAMKTRSRKTNQAKTPPPAEVGKDGLNRELPMAIRSAKVGRAVPAALKREVYLRDRCCVQCGSIHHLNIDHRQAYALGGKSTTDNLRLLCFHCNQRARVRMRL